MFISQNVKKKCKTFENKKFIKIQKKKKNSYKMEPTCMKTLHSTANIGELGLFFKGQVHSKMADFFSFRKKILYKGRLLTKISASKELI